MQLWLKKLVRVEKKMDQNLVTTLLQAPVPENKKHLHGSTLLWKRYNFLVPISN